VNGTCERRWVPLKTFDRALAGRMKDKIVAELTAGRVRRRGKAQAVVPETFRTAALRYCDERAARGVAMADNERGLLQNHVLGHIGAMPVHAIGKADCKRVLDAAVTKGLGKESVGHVGGCSRGSSPRRKAMTSSRRARCAS
jgi:hypothetical protein